MTTPLNNTLEELLNTEDEDSAAESILLDASALGLPTTNWANDSFAVTLIRVIARTVAELSGTVTDIAKGTVLGLAEADWLDLLAASQYQLVRNSSAFALVRVRLTVAPGQGPHTIQPNQLWIRRDSDNRRWNSANIVPVVLTSAMPVDVDFIAENAGSRWGALLGQVIDIVTPLSGLSASFQDAGEGSPVVTAGADTETDVNLESRCRARWDTIGVQKTDGAYTALALSPEAGAMGVTRVFVDSTNPRGPGTVDVWLSANESPAGAADVTAIDAYLQPRKSPSTDLLVSAAVPLAVSVTAVLEHDAGALPVPEATEQVRALIATQPDVLYRSAVAEALMAPAGARNVVLSTILINGVASDLARLPNQVLVSDVILITGSPL
jgi:hypothetical protein